MTSINVYMIDEWLWIPYGNKQRQTNKTAISALHITLKHKKGYVTIVMIRIIFLVILLFYGEKHCVKSWSCDMETLSALLAFCEGNYWSLIDSPKKGQYCETLLFPGCWPSKGLLNKQLVSLWFKTLWFLCDMTVIMYKLYICSWANQSNMIWYCIQHNDNRRI